MERIFNQLTGAIRNGYSVKQYLKKANLLNDKEIRIAAAKGFSDVSSFLIDMLEINENSELRKDFFHNRSIGGNEKRWQYLFCFLSHFHNLIFFDQDFFHSLRKLNSLMK